MLDEQKMLQMIANEPLILEVRLADKFDCDIEDIETALLPHLNRRVFVREVTAPNGRKAPAYVLSDEYRAVVLAGQVARDPDVERRAAIRDSAPGVNMDTVSAPIQPPAPITTRARLGEPRITNPQKAIDFLAAAPGNRCTTKEMLAALGLPQTSSPNAYLRDATKNGRIRRDGQDWVLGTALLNNIETVGNNIVATKDASPIPQVVVDAVAASPTSGKVAFSPQEVALTVIERATAEAYEQAAPTFRCGMFSDGVLELHRDGKVIAALSPDEVDHVAQFIDRRAA